MRRWLWLPGVAAILWLLQFVRNAVPPFADLTLSNDGDVALHVVLGDLMLKQGLLPTEPTSVLGAERPFLAHEWLSEVVFALLHHAFGLAGPIFLVAAVVATLGVAMFRRATRLGAGTWPAIVALGGAFMIQNGHLNARPHVLTWALGFAVVTWLDRLGSGELTTRGFLLRAVPTVILWAQLHAGVLVVVPLCVAYVGGALLDGLGADGRAGLRRAGTFAAVGLALLLASGVNPWGFRLHAHFLAWLGNDVMTGFTTEFQPPDFRGAAGRMLLAWFGLGLLGLAGSRRRPDASHLLLWLGLGAMSLQSARHGAIFATFTMPAVASWLQRTIDGFAGEATRAGRLAHEVDASSRRLAADEADRGGWALVGLIAAAVVSCVGVLRAPEVRFRPDLQPVAATDWIEAHASELPGQMFNAFNWGAYLAYRLYPDRLTFVNSWHDHLGEEAIRTYLRVHRVEPGWDGVLDAHHVGWVVFDTASGLAVALDADPRWRRVYRDPTASIWVRAN